MKFTPRKLLKIKNWQKNKNQKAQRPTFGHTPDIQPLGGGHDGPHFLSILSAISSGQAWFPWVHRPESTSIITGEVRDSSQPCAGPKWEGAISGIQQQTNWAILRRETSRLYTQKTAECTI
jgi:hypothetical protein